MAATREPKAWLLERYARFIPSEKKGLGEWKESIPLYGPQKERCIKAIRKGDSMLFFCKSENSVRRFRIQFSKGPTTSEQDNCLGFLQAISEYVQVKTIENQDDESNSQSGSQSLLAEASQSQLNSSIEYLPPNKTKKTSDSKIFSTKSIRQIAESLMMKQTSESSESCISGSFSMLNKDMDSLVKSCLLDPDFPSFVGQVDESLKRLLSE